MLQYLQEKVGAISYFPTGIHFKGPVSSKKLFMLPAITNSGNEVGKNIYSLPLKQCFHEHNRYHYQNCAMRCCVLHAQTVHDQKSVQIVTFLRW